jgi:hypothetical protein
LRARVVGTRSEHAVPRRDPRGSRPLCDTTGWEFRRLASPLAAQTYMFVTKRFYSLYERTDIRFDLIVPASCVKDEFGFYDDFKCDDAVRNNAEWEIRVIQTQPTRLTFDDVPQYGNSRSVRQ